MGSFMYEVSVAGYDSDSTLTWMGLAGVWPNWCRGEADAASSTFKPFGEKSTLGE
jgi:hypothetical protein